MLKPYVPAIRYGNLLGLDEIEDGGATNGQVLAYNTSTGVWAPTSSVASGLTSAHIFVGNGSNLATDVAVSGDISINNTGVTAIGAGKVLLAMLGAGIAPSHVVKFAGTSAPYGGGGTSVAITVTGALATDVATAVIRASTNAVSIAKAVLTSNTLTITFSADPGAATTIDYSILRAAA